MAVKPPVTLSSRATAALLLIVALVQPASARQDAPPASEFIYTWLPRSTDLPDDPSAPDRRLLHVLLRLAVVTDYRVVNGDSIDFIIRKRLLVSARWRNAYSEYRTRFVELNPGITDATILQLNQPLKLPSGPQYGGTYLSLQFQRADTALAVYSTAAPKAYTASDTGTMASGSIREKNRASLQYFVASTPGRLSEMEDSAVDRALERRRLIAPIDVAAHPEERLTQVQIVQLQNPSADPVSFDELKTIEKAGNLLPAYLPADAGPSVSCAACVKCGDALRLPAGLDVSRARLLIQDTGIAPGMLKVPQNLIYVPDGESADDVSPEKHGTYIYNQVTKSGAGPLDDRQVYVAKVARRTSSGQVAYWIGDIIASWREFKARMDTSTGAAGTVVVNLSAQGEPTVGTQPPPLPPFPEVGSLLVVAAAGNHQSSTEPRDQAFGRLANGNTPLLIVGALNDSAQPATYTNHHALNVQLFARGDCDCGTANAVLNGTSQAAPLVSVAAAIVASRRPQWSPREVMWRLVSTADAMPGKAFGGVVNLPRALQSGILVTHATGVVVAKALKLDADWRQAFDNAIADEPLSVVLRLSGPRASGETICFEQERFLQFAKAQMCAPGASLLTLTLADGSQQTIPWNTIRDLILPLPQERLPTASSAFIATVINP
jgi:subtilisin family serine protease